LNIFRKFELVRRFGLAKNGALLFFGGTLVAAGLHFLYQALMSRMLGPAVYGALGSLIALTTIVTLAAAALQAAITHAVASTAHLESEWATAMSMRRPLQWALAGGALCFTVIAATSPLFERYLHLKSALPVVLFGLFVAVTLVGIIPQGLLMGRLRFSTVAVAIVANAAVRCALGVVLVELNFGLNGAMAAAAFASAVQLVMLVYPVRTEMRRVSAIEDRFIRTRAVILAVVALGGVSTFIGIDSFLARHYLPRVESGYYVAAATGAKITLFLPAAVTQMAFPRIARVIADPAKIRRILAENFTFVAILGIASTLVIFAFSHLIVSILFGHRFDVAAGTIGILSVSSAELGVMTLMTYYFLARRMIFATFSWLGVAGAALAIWGFHANPTEIAKVMVVTTSATLLVQVVVAWFSLPRDSLAADSVVTPRGPFTRHRPVDKETARPRARRRFQGPASVDGASGLS
jgi:O-antigen/teichoic acid export membrane protein